MRAISLGYHDVIDDAAEALAAFGPVKMVYKIDRPECGSLPPHGASHRGIPEKSLAQLSPAIARLSASGKRTHLSRQPRPVRAPAPRPVRSSLPQTCAGRCIHQVQRPNIHRPPQWCFSGVPTFRKTIPSSMLDARLMPPNTAYS